MKLYTTTLNTLCLAAGISLIATACGPAENNDDNATTNVTNAQLLDCSSFGDALTLTDEVQDGVDYIVDCNASVRGELVIEPGVIIQFKDEAGLEVSGEGSITAEGTAEDPIILTAENQEAGAWRGIYVESSSAKNKLSYVEIEYAGGQQFNSNGDKGSIVLYSGGKLSLKNSTISDSANYGFNNNYAAELTFENNTITGSELHPITIEAGIMHQLDTASTLTGNGKDSVRVTDGAVSGITATWNKLSVPYFVDNEIRITGDSVINIAPGASFVFASDTGISLGEGASFAAEGTAEEKISFTGELEEKGSWLGIFINSNDPKNKFEHVVIDYAGGGSFNSNDDRGALILYSGSKFSLKNSTISNSKTFGVNADYDLSGLSFENNTITGCEQEPVSIPLANLSDIDAGSDLTGNARDYVRANGRTSFTGTVAATWNTLSVPYFFANNNVYKIQNEGGVTIEAGTKLVFGANAGLQVNEASSLTAVGTAEKKIEFVGEDAAAESWRGIMFYSNDTSNRLEHVIVKSGGSDSFNSNGDEGGVIVYADAQVTLKDVEITDSGECAVNASYRSSVVIEEGTNVLTGLTASICLPD